MADNTPVLVTTTHAVEGRRINAYKGLVGGDAPVENDAATAADSGEVVKRWLQRVLKR